MYIFIKIYPYYRPKCPIITWWNDFGELKQGAEMERLPFTRFILSISGHPISRRNTKRKHLFVEIPPPEI